MTFYVLNEGDNKFESMTKEQILTAIQQAVSTGEIKDVNTGFVTTIKEQNHNQGLKFWYGTMAEFAALVKKEPNTFYIFSDDTTLQDIENQFKDQKTFNDYVNVELGKKANSSDVEQIKNKHIYQHNITITTTALENSSPKRTCEFYLTIINNNSNSINSRSNLIDNLQFNNFDVYASAYGDVVYDRDSICNVTGIRNGIALDSLLVFVTENLGSLSEKFYFELEDTETRQIEISDNVVTLF